ncbi:two component, sigma54 specific, transcriptional regulator, Fis family [Isosphaera pallida ATCC 43644]|uniref:Two component, sigma54 specific, transcriptional regulator, Fis family n=1 Tax=Isosphaera pallida (strain ATCC 43644 / DSM 9630 / IS1B) TaxID=575540 RepID=E8QZ20_ISOPI|nr:sigma-54 dependent transcriptional regulator [Isosphaera pallida]ADV63162.1 two component, sigma54 specific, transcriptional regulator, Fis family [Isosphaera pallida ATCC 43644]
MSASATSPAVLIADDDEALLEVVSGWFRRWRFRPSLARNRAEVMEQVERERPQVVLLDVKLGTDDGVEILGELRARLPDLVIVLTTAFGTIDHAVRAMQMGARDYLTKPIESERLKTLLQEVVEEIGSRAGVGGLGGTEASAEAMEGRSANDLELAEAQAAQVLLGAHPIMVDLRRTIARVAASDAEVLIMGESGTGKELVARLIHQLSPHREGPYIAVNMAALPAHLAESQLFGFVKGSFTDAYRDQVGYCEAASNGTLFLDEIGEMPLEIQAKLLRFLEDRTIQRIGERTNRTVSTRVVSATHRDLAELVREGKFRQDLYYRLNVVPITVPSLRQHPQDIPDLARVFLRRQLERNPNSPVRDFTPEALRCLTEYDWPGNVRELEHVIHRLVILGRRAAISREELPPEILRHASPLTPSGGMTASTTPTTFPASTTIREATRQLLIETLRVTNGNVNEAARRLGRSRAWVYDQVRKYGIDLANL